MGGGRLLERRQTVQDSVYVTVLGIDGAGNGELLPRGRVFSLGHEPFGRTDELTDAVVKSRTVGMSAGCRWKQPGPHAESPLVADSHALRRHNGPQKIGVKRDARYKAGSWKSRGLAEIYYIPI